MKKLITVTFILLIIPIVVFAKDIGNISSSKVDAFPKSWRTWPFQGGDAKRVYKVKEQNGKKYLHAFDKWDLSEQIFFKFPWKVKKEPILSWKWRPTVLPKKAREDKNDMNDSACGVYVIFGQYTGYALKYVWSTTLPVGKVVTRRDGKLKITVIGTGKKGLNEWHDVKVNVIEDHKKLFGDKIPKWATGIAVLTDGNATHTPAGCDYSDFKVE